MTIGGLAISVVAPELGLPVAGAGKLVSWTGNGLQAWANWREGDYGALAGNAFSAATGAGTSRVARKLGSGAVRASNGKFAPNPLGGAYKNAKAQAAQTTASKTSDAAVKAARCAK